MPMSEMQLQLALPDVREVQRILPDILCTNAVNGLGAMMSESVVEGFLDTYRLLAPEVFSRGEIFYPDIIRTAEQAVYRKREAIIEDLLDRIVALPAPSHFEDYEPSSKPVAQDDADPDTDLDSDPESPASKSKSKSNTEKRPKQDRIPGSPTRTTRDPASKPEPDAGPTVRRYDIIRKLLHTAIDARDIPSVEQILDREECPLYMLCSALVKATEMHDAEMASLLVADLMRDKKKVTKFVSDLRDLDPDDYRFFNELSFIRATFIQNALKLSVEKQIKDVTAVLLPTYLDCIVGHPTSRMAELFQGFYRLGRDQYRFISRDLCLRLMRRDIPVNLKCFLIELMQDNVRSKEFPVVLGSGNGLATASQEVVVDSYEEVKYEYYLV